MLTCSKCDNQQKSGKFCGKCGSPLIAEHYQSEQFHTEEDKQFNVDENANDKQTSPIDEDD